MSCSITALEREHASVKKNVALEITVNFVAQGFVDFINKSQGQ